MDKDLLLYEIKKNKMTVSSLCKEVGISKSAFYRKCSGKTQFTLPEVKKIVSILNLESPATIFFAD